MTKSSFLFRFFCQLSLFPDFQQRKMVLRSLSYIEFDSDTVTMKGRVACEMNTCDELLAAEIILNNILEPLNPPECVAVLSALICQVSFDFVPKTGVISLNSSLTSSILCRKRRRIRHLLHIEWRWHERKYWNFYRLLKEYR